MGKENIWLKKEIGQYDDRQSHLFCDFNIYEFQRNQFYSYPSDPPPKKLADATHKAYILYTQQLTDSLGARESSEGIRGDIFGHTLLFPSLIIYFLWR